MIDVRIRLVTLRRFLTIAVIVLPLLGLALELAQWLGGFPFERLVALFSLSQEANIPTYYQSGVLLAAGALLAAIGAMARKGKEPFARHWTVLGLIFCYLSLDEFASIHEQLDTLLPGRGWLYFSWVIPYSILVPVFAISYLRFLFRLPRRTAILFAVAGTIYVGGALGVEFPLGWWTEQNGFDNVGYVLIDWVEEALEMIGAAIFLVAVAEVFHQRVRSIRIETVGREHEPPQTATG